MTYGRVPRNARDAAASFALQSVGLASSYLPLQALTLELGVHLRNSVSMCRPLCRSVCGRPCGMAPVAVQKCGGASQAGVPLRMMLVSRACTINRTYRGITVWHEDGRKCDVEIPHRDFDAYPDLGLRLQPET